MQTSQDQTTAKPENSDNISDANTDIPLSTVSQSKPMAAWQRGLYLRLLRLLAFTVAAIAPGLILALIKPEFVQGLVIYIVGFVIIVIAARFAILKIAASWGVPPEDMFRHDLFVFIGRARRNYAKSGQFWRGFSRSVSGQRSCPNCRGTGKAGGVTCRRCGGTGKVIGSL